MQTRRGRTPARWPYNDGLYTVAELAELKRVPCPTLHSRIQKFKARLGSDVLAAHLAMSVKSKPYKKRRRAGDDLDMSHHRRLNELWRPHNRPKTKKPAEAGKSGVG